MRENYAAQLEALREYCDDALTTYNKKLEVRIDKKLRKVK